MLGMDQTILAPRFQAHIAKLQKLFQRQPYDEEIEDLDSGRDHVEISESRW